VSRVLAFLGAGEFEPWSEPVDRWVLERAAGDGRVLILPTASAPEGDEVFEGWARKGLEHFAALGVPAEVLPIKRREDAERGDLAERVRAASVVYASGGNPSYLADVLRGSAVCRALWEGMEAGLGYVGCSAGVACLTETTYDTAVLDLASEAVWAPGLGYARGVLFAPHWDTVERWYPGAQAFIAASLGPGETLVGIDEATAMVGDGSAWSVLGRSAVHVYREGRWRTVPAGEGFELALELGPPRG
jgi:cyanophycinase